MPIRVFMFCLALVLARPPVARGVGDARPASGSSTDRYVPIEAMARLYGLTYERENADRLRLSGEWVSLDFEKNSRRVLVNGTLLWLHLPVVEQRGGWRIADVDIRDVLDPLVRPRPALDGVRIRTILLDPGHGGDDSGAARNGLEEKDLVLDVAVRLAPLLEEAGFTVRLTRTDDHFLSLDERVALARRLQPDLFVSLHFNAASTAGAAGVEVFVTTSPGYPSTNSPETRPPRIEYPNHRFSGPNAIAGYLVQQALRNATGAEDRGVRRARFHVIKNAPCPAVLVESGFLSNPSEHAALGDDRYLDAIAGGIAAGIRNYATAVCRAGGESPPMRGNTATRNKVDP